MKEKITRPMSQPISDSQCQHMAAKPKCRIFAQCSLDCFFREVGEEEDSLFCYPSAIAAKCLYPQRRRGSFGLVAHIVKSAFVLKSQVGFFFVLFCFNTLNIPVSSCPLLIL